MPTITITNGLVNTGIAIQPGNASISIDGDTTELANLPTVEADGNLSFVLEDHEYVVGAVVRVSDPLDQQPGFRFEIIKIELAESPGPITPSSKSTSTLSRAVDTARQLVAVSPAFINRQSQYGADQIEPINRVYLYQAEHVELMMSMRDLRPFAVVGLGDDISWDAISPGCVNHNLIVGGGVYVILVDNARFTDLGSVDEDGNQTPGADQQGDSYCDFLNFSGGVADDMSNVFGTPADLIGFNGIELIEPGIRTEIDQRQNDDYWAAALKFSFGESSF